MKHPVVVFMNKRYFLKSLQIVIALLKVHVTFSISQLPVVATNVTITNNSCNRSPILLATIPLLLFLPPRRGGRVRCKTAKSVSLTHSLPFLFTALESDIVSSPQMTTKYARARLSPRVRRLVQAQRVVSSHQRHGGLQHRVVQLILTAKPSCSNRNQTLKHDEMVTSNHHSCKASQKW